MDVQWKVWLEFNEKKIFGRGPSLLLKKIDELGSLRKAAQDINMSYSKAWNLVAKLEEAIKEAVVEKRIGGSDGGGSKLTDKGRLLVEKYDEFEKMVEQSVKDLYESKFSEFL
ncbi:MAG: LysR family transcriptional regulator [Firmicutes bacterium]|jgi:molybdate transport system regulatory protein|nr:LysR family transcriptional regulator [Bacillota bacterium]